ncbi:MAG: response regulator [Proteobacteria bacterium]|nr:response regulator [Pseudomonadota bacterium]
MRILVTEDNAILAEGIARALRSDGYAVDVASDGMIADAALAAETFDVAVLDLGLPGMDGMDVLRRLRARKGDTAVLILTARDGLGDRIKGLDLGADDYMVKPFELSELEARVRALIRRRVGLRSSVVELGRLSFDMSGRIVRIDGVSQEIPQRELDVLETLILRAGQVVSKEKIIESLVDFEHDVSSNAIEQYVSRLRRRLEPAGIKIRAVRGLGYILEVP